MVPIKYRDYIKLKPGQLIYIETYDLDGQFRDKVYMRFVGTTPINKFKYKKGFTFQFLNNNTFTTWNIVGICEPFHVQVKDHKTYLYYRGYYVRLKVYRVTNKDLGWFVADLLTLA